MSIKSVVGSSQLVSPSRSSSMVDGAHFKDLQEAQNKLDHLLQIEIMKREAADMKIQDQISGTDKKLDHLTQTLAEIQLQLLQLGKKHVSSEALILENREHTLGSTSLTVGSPINHFHSSLLRIDFPRFDGSNPRAWIEKCSSYFRLIPNVPDAQKINLAIKHFDGKALVWYQNLNMMEIGITWVQFLEVICARFEYLRVSYLLVELNELTQNGSYDDYVERFEELRAYILLNDNYRYSEDSFVASFLSGLSEELQAFINLFQPTHLEQAIELGRKRIHTLDAFSKMMSPDASSFQIQFPTCKRTDAVSPQIPSRVSNTISTNLTTKLITVVGMTGEDGILDAQKAKKMLPPDAEFDDIVVLENDAGFVLATLGDLNLISRKFSTLDPCGQGSAAAGGMVMAYVKKKRKVTEVGGWEMFVLTGKSKAIDEKIEDHVMTFAVFLNGKRVKLKSLTTAVENIFAKEPVLITFTHEEMKDIEHIFVLGNDAKPETSTLTVDLFLEKCTNTFKASGPELKVILLQNMRLETYMSKGFSVRNQALSIYKRDERQFQVGDMIFLKFHPLLQHSFLRIGKKIIPVMKYFEDEAARASILGTRVVTGRINNVSQSFVVEVQLELMFVEEVHQESQSILQIRAQEVKIELQFAIREGLHLVLCKFPSFDPWGQGSFEQRGIVMDREGLKLKKEGRFWKKEELRIGIEFNSVKKMKKSKNEKLGLESILGHMHYFDLGHWLCLCSLGLV